MFDKIGQCKRNSRRYKSAVSIDLNRTIVALSPLGHLPGLIPSKPLRLAAPEPLRLSNYPKTALTRFSVNRLDSPWLFQGGQGWPGNARNARQPRRLAPFGKSLMTCGIAFVRSSRRFGLGKPRCAGSRTGG